MAITREDLYRTVWAAPMLKVARDHGVSPNYLARVCRHLNVPHPPRGYWAKLAAGLTPHVPPLPANRPGEVLAWERGDSVPHIRARRPAPASVSSPKDATIDRHELVRGVRESFESGRLSEVGYLRPYKRNLVDILVTKKALQSALDAANVLFMALEERGHRVTLAPDNRFGRPELAVYEGQTFDHYRGQPWAPGRPTIVFIGSTAIGLSLYELTELVEATYQWDGPIRYVRVDPASRRRSSRWQAEIEHREQMPSGLLGLRAYAPHWDVAWERRWTERKPGEFSSLVKRIARELAAAAPEIQQLEGEAAERAAAQRKQWEEAERERRRVERERRRAEALTASQAELRDIITTWSEARAADAFFNDAHQRALSEEDGLEVERRIELARGLLGGTDALRRLRAWRAPEER